MVCGIGFLGTTKKDHFTERALNKRADSSLLVFSFPFLSPLPLPLLPVSLGFGYIARKERRGMHVYGFGSPISTKHCLWAGETCSSSFYHLLSPSSFVSLHHLLSGVSGGSIADFLFFFSLFFPFCLEILCTMITDTQDETNFFYPPSFCYPIFFPVVFIQSSAFIEIYHATFFFLEVAAVIVIFKRCFLSCLSL